MDTIIHALGYFLFGLLIFLIILSITGDISFKIEYGREPKTLDSITIGKKYKAKYPIHCEQQSDDYWATIQSGDVVVVRAISSTRTVAAYNRREEILQYIFEEAFKDAFEEVE